MSDPVEPVVPPVDPVVPPVDPNQPTYTWKILSMKVLEEVDNLKNVVVLVSWSYTCDYMEKSNTICGDVNLTLPEDSETFIPFEDLKETDVIAWVESSLASQIDFYQSFTLNKIKADLSPQPVPIDLPW